MKLLVKSTIAAIVAASVSAQATTIKFSHVVAEATPKGQMALKFKELVEQKTGGDVTVEVYPNSQLFDDNKVIEAMLLGDVQIAAPSLSKFNKYTQQLNVFDLPFLFKDMDAVACFQEGKKGQELLSSMTSVGLVGMGYLHNGLKQLSANKEIHTPADISGLKFRIQSSDVLAAQFEAVDAIPVKKPFSEVFTLLQTKAIDGQENTWSNIYSKKFFEVQDSVIESNHGLIDYLVITSASFLDSLDDDTKMIVQDAMNEAIAHGNEIAAEKAVSDRQNVVDGGYAKVIELTDEERQQWVIAMKPVWDQFSGDIGQDMIDAATACN